MSIKIARELDRDAEDAMLRKMRRHVLAMRRNKKKERLALHGSAGLETGYLEACNHMLKAIDDMLPAQP